MFYNIMKYLIAGPLLKYWFRPWTRGTQNVPETGPAILASNHLAVIDSFVLPVMLERRVNFMGKAEYFRGRGLKGKFVAFFMKGVGTIPVDRSGGRNSEAALEAGLSVLQRGELFGIYPEGTRSPDGRLYRGKTGVARLAIEAGVPVIPVVMVDTNAAQQIGQRLPKPVRLGIIFGEPLDFSRYQGMADDRFALRAATDEIMHALVQLSGQEYVDIYATTQKARLAREARVAATSA